MSTAYIVDAVRTAGGKRGGALAGVHPVDLGAAVFDAIADRNDFDPAAIDDVITGCVIQGGQQAAAAPSEQREGRAQRGGVEQAQLSGSGGGLGHGAGFPCAHARAPGGL